MNLRTFQGGSMAHALTLVKKEMGGDAVILHTRTYRTGGWLGIGGKNVVEITASNDVNVTPRPRNAQPKTETRLAVGVSPRAAGNTLQRTYSATSGAATAVLDVPPPKKQSLPAADDQLAAELRQLRTMVQRVVKSAAPQPQQQLPDAMFEQYLALIEQEVAEDLAKDIVDQVRKKVNNNFDDPRLVHDAVRDAIAQYIPTGAPQLDRVRGLGRPYTLALIGPTGVGKTTTVAKLAATFKLRDKLNVALVTIDTYRIAAVDQLRTYAQIIGVPLHVANTPLELKQAISRCAAAGAEVVLIDTAGRSQRDDAKLDELRAFIEAADVHEVHLVLSSAAGEKVIMEAARRFASIRADRIIFTKLDEAVSFGVLLNVVRRVGKTLSFITTGQEVPHQIERGEGRRVAEMILGGHL
ncbi:MAG: flagellar biosynthesis protein FlhF [Phycisphaerales bacterium]